MEPLDSRGFTKDLQWRCVVKAEENCGLFVRLDTIRWYFKINDMKDLLNINPNPLTIEEWKEVMAVPEVRESWGIEDDETPADFAAQVYAANFNFVSGSPGYVGDLFILQGDTLTGDAPFVLQRDRNGKLRVL